MGRANRDRRRMKERARRRRPPASPPHAASPQAAASPAQEAAALVEAAVAALMAGEGDATGGLVQRLAADRGSAWSAAVDRALNTSLRHMVTFAWHGGWQPVDVVRVVRRHLRAAHLVLARAVIAEEMSCYAQMTVDPRWRSQIAEVAAVVWWPSTMSAVQACAQQARASRADFLLCAVQLLAALRTLPAQQVLLPLPGSVVPTARGDTPPDVDERILARVRALLAKAESTNFPAEAETFTAGAQALMARHAIDHAMLAASGRAPADQPMGRRIGIDAPYEAAKAALLESVASANRSRVVWSRQYGFATVVGHPADLDTVEVLFTSLLVQAVAAVAREGRRLSGDGVSRTRSFRQSFLVSYAHRIGERLSESTRRETDVKAAQAGRDTLLPVLRSRDEAVERAMVALFPQTVELSVKSSWDGEGWARGRAAAQLAALEPATPISGMPSAGH